jgi:uncharacterized protein YndB with AHSA1/START domain
MTVQHSEAAQTQPKEVVITRDFDAPRDLVFKAWTDPKHVAQWWGPHGFTNPVCKWDARPGGAIYVEMTDPDGVVYPMRGVFHEVTAPERLVFTSTALHDEDGSPHLEVLTTITLEEHESGKTRFTLRAEVVRATPQAAGALAGMEVGWSQSLEKLAGHLSGAAA